MEEELYIQKHVVLERRTLLLDGVVLCKGTMGLPVSDFFQELYRFLEINYQKFFKMDMLSKMLFLATEALLKGSGLSSTEANSNVAVVLYNSHSSFYTDKQFQETIRSDAFFPSPSLFVYTLPNMALGEVAIRNKFMGENCTFITPNFDQERCVEYVSAIMKGTYSHVICGWFDLLDDREEVELFIVSKEKSSKIFNVKNLIKPEYYV